MTPTVLPPLSPMLAIKGAKAAMDWYKQYLGAEEIMRLTDPAGQVVHGELKVGGGVIMLAEEDPAHNLSPATAGHTTVILNLIVDEVDSLFASAIAGGSTVIFPVNDQFYGYRSGRFQDPFGHQWIVGKLLEEMTEAEMQKRFDKLIGC
ncbi:VOC family protein [Planctomicrobium piriforme]|uniref:PhnB protein n=1 Tax=Planctomicrobium piriforme TaxID=1576369 RepID=A0A1I3F6H9_9PLAN|nr:VOC family protein [Planctomicrobium piriforme]SFI06750.1 PhnB protein [Planctomicrobium piriforme]